MTERVTTVTVNGVELDLLGPGVLEVDEGRGWWVTVHLASGVVDPGMEDMRIRAITSDGMAYEGAVAASVSDSSGAHGQLLTVSFSGLGEPARVRVP